MPIEKKLIRTLDDDPVMLNLTVAIIKKENLVRPFVSVETAFKFLALKRRPQVDLMLLDYYMPEMEGPEVLRRLRADPAYASIPVVFLTGLEEAEHSRKLLEQGAVDVIGKPPVAETLMAAIRNILEN